MEAISKRVLKNNIYVFFYVINAILLSIGYVISPKIVHATPTSFNGFQWEQLGQAQISITQAGLQVSNLGNTGDDGVRLIVPEDFRFLDQTEAFHHVISNSGLGTPSSPVGSFFQMSVYGTINGIPGQLINSLTATTIEGGGVNLKVDMSPIAPTSMTVHYYNNGELVLTETGLPEIEYDIPGMETPNDWGTVNDMGEDFTWLTPVPVPTFGGGTVFADDVVFIPVGSEVIFGGYSALEFTGSQINGFVVEQIPEPSSISLLSLALVLLCFSLRFKTQITSRNYFSRCYLAGLKSLK